MTDPRRACANKEERLLWALLHDGVAHPLMALTLFSRWAVAFHDWTSQRAWPRIEDRPAKTGPNFWSTDSGEAERIRGYYKRQGLAVWSRSTPMGDGVFLYEVGPL